MSMASNVLLVGGGGLGVIAALSLEASSKAKVTAVLRSNYDIVSSNGYRIKSCDYGEISGWRPAKVVNYVPKVALDELPYDFIIIATKNVPGSGRSLAELIKPAVTMGVTNIVLIQNGLNIEREYIQEYPDNIILSGVSFAGSQETEPGFIEHGSHDHLLIGAFRNPNISVTREEEAAKAFVSLYAASGKVSCFYTADTLSQRWRKLVYNATMNPLCAIVNLDSGTLRQSGQEILKMLYDAMDEIMAVAVAAGYALPIETPHELLRDDPVEGRFEPSMLQDARKVKLIEHEYLVGEPMREGLRLGVPVPTIQTLYALCQVMQNKMMRSHHVA